MLKLCTGALAGFFVLGAVGSASAAACADTGYIKNSTNLTAALINPGTVDGQDVDATGCDIGVYYAPGTTGAVQNGSNIHGARYFGVLTNGAKVSVTDSVIHDIGEVPYAAGNLGVGIGCAIESPQTSGGLIRGNTIYNYQKNGIDLRGANCGGAPGKPVQILANQISGKGPTEQIAQNGIVAGLGASNLFISNNNIGGHSYTGSNPAASAGINIFGGPCDGSLYQKNMTVTKNRLLGNDVALFLLNYEITCTNAPPGASPNNIVTNNDMFNFAVLNTSGNGTGPYQVAISITDTRTKVEDNNICGDGYRPANQPDGGLVGLFDPAGSNSLKLTHNACFDRPSNSDVSVTMAAQDSVAKSAAPSGKKTQSSP